MPRFRALRQPSRKSSSTAAPSAQQQRKQQPVDPDRQARQLIGKYIAQGKSRHERRDENLLHGRRTTDHYRQALTRAAKWMINKGYPRGLHNIDEQLFEEFLQYRATRLTQDGLDYESAILRRIVPQLQDIERPRVVALKEPTRLSTENRANTPAQAQAIIDLLEPDDALSACLIANTGIRVSEPPTLADPKDRPPSPHRRWSPERYAGMGPGREYTEIGKGGLIMPIWVPQHLVPAVEAKRLPVPVWEKDHRGNWFKRYFDLPGGTEFGKRFAKASKAVVGKKGNKGPHGLRHMFAQIRLAYHMDQGHSYKEARRLVSQQVGHFRDQITKTYLRD